jgi:hypothetical protein
MKRSKPIPRRFPSVVALHESTHPRCGREVVSGAGKRVALILAPPGNDRELVWPASYYAFTINRHYSPSAGG